MKTLYSAVALAVTVTLTGCMEPTDVTRQIPVDENFSEFTFGWNGAPGTMVLRWAVITNASGTMEVCGAQGKTGAFGSEHYGQMLRDSVIIANGKPIMGGLQYFSSVGSANQLVGSDANCRDTGLPRPTGQVRFQLVPNNKDVYRI